MDMSSTIIQTFLCMMEAFRRVSWFIVKVPFYVQATVTLIRNPLGKPLLDGDPSQCLKNKLNQAESDLYFFAAPYAFAMMTSLH